VLRGQSVRHVPIERVAIEPASRNDAAQVAIGPLHQRVQPMNELDIGIASEPGKGFGLRALESRASDFSEQSLT